MKLRGCKQDRFGFTLVELLVVIAIIGILVALLLPAIQAAREAARRSQCQNNLKQLGIATHMFHDTHKFFPSAGWSDWWVGCPDMGMGKSQPGSWAYQLLNFIEESAAAGLGQGFKCGDVNSKKAVGQMVSTPVSSFYCPSRRAAKGYPYVNTNNSNFNPPPVMGKSDYLCNVGDLQYVGTDDKVNAMKLDQWQTFLGWQYSGRAFIVNQQLKCSTGQTGISFQRSMIKMKQVTDGTSLTYLYGEKNLDANKYETGDAGNDDQSMYNGFDRDNCGSAYWAASPDTPNVQLPWVFGGAHPSGWMAVFCDASVHFLTYDMTLENHRRFANRQDGEVIDSNAL